MTDQSSTPLTGRTALVTGGTRGIGAATAEALAAQGASVIATYRSDVDTATKFAADVTGAHAGTVDVMPFDLTADEDADGSVEALLESLQHRDIDILVVNAAAPYPKDGLRELSAQALTTKVTADVGATHRLVSRLAPAMLDRGFGRIVVVGSLHSLGPTAPGMAANGVSKAAQAAYVNFAVDELTGPGVTINIVEPGFTATDASAHLPVEVSQMISGLTPSGRTGRPGDVAAAVTLLVQDSAGFLNGVRIPVAGGLNTPVAIGRVLAAAKGR